MKIKLQQSRGAKAEQRTPCQPTGLELRNPLKCLGNCRGGQENSRGGPQENTPTLLTSSK
eukprot:1144733-Pelagomonas_calceolata.AAC.2